MVLVLGIGGFHQQQHDEGRERGFAIHCSFLVNDARDDGLCDVPLDFLVQGLPPPAHDGGGADAPPHGRDRVR